VNTITEELRPAYLALLLGLVFSEEISLSWTNVAMFVRGMPSISAYSVTSGMESDWLRKVPLIALAWASVSSGTTQTVMTLVGLALTCSALLANLGSRAWGFMQWRPIGKWGPFEPLIAYFGAMLAGICVPYLGHRQVESGGKAAMESVLCIAFMVAAIFVISDYDEIQKILVVGSEVSRETCVSLHRRSAVIQAANIHAPSYTELQSRLCQYWCGCLVVSFADSISFHSSSKGTRRNMA
jgi:hypothetical protein